MKLRVLRHLCETALTLPDEEAARLVIARGALRHVLVGAARGRNRASARSAERKRIVRYLKSAGLYEAAAMVESSKDGAICDREGYWIRGVDGVLRCDSGHYERDAAGAPKCTLCRLGAA